MMRAARRLAVISLGAVLAACAELPSREPPPPVSQNTAVVALLDTARVDLAAGRPDTAGAALERALRIEPRNPVLWHELARVRLGQRQYQQAEALALKSNSWAGDNRALRAANWRAIGDARVGLGQRDAAQAAFDKAAELDK